MNFKTLQTQLVNARADLADLEAKYADARLKQLKMVEMVKNDASTTLVFKGRTINARKNTHNRYVVKESGKTLINEYFGSIHDLRFDIAQGMI